MRWFSFFIELKLSVGVERCREVSTREIMTTFREIMGNFREIIKILARLSSVSVRSSSQKLLQGPSITLTTAAEPHKTHLQTHHHFNTYLFQKLYGSIDAVIGTNTYPFEVNFIENDFKISTVSTRSCNKIIGA